MLVGGLSATGAAAKQNSSEFVPQHICYCVNACWREEYKSMIVRKIDNLIPAILKQLPKGSSFIRFSHGGDVFGVDDFDKLEKLPFFTVVFEQPEGSPTYSRSKVKDNKNAVRRIVDKNEAIKPLAAGKKEWGALPNTDLEDLDERAEKAAKTLDIDTTQNRINIIVEKAEYVS